MADDIRELNALIADYGREFQSPDPRSGPSLASARLYNVDYQPATATEQAEMVLSMLPGFGEGLDAAHFVKDIQDENYGQAGLSGLAMVLPGVGAATVKKIGKPVIDKFTTSRGSTYELFDDATTQRNRSGVGHKDTSTGLQPVSNKTVFVDKEGLVNVGGIFQNPDIATRLNPVFDDKGNITSMAVDLTEDFGPRRAGERIAEVPVTTRPAVGKYPVEIMSPESPRGSSGRGVHFGSEIIDVQSQTPNRISIFPKPERMFDKADRPRGGEYLNPETQDVLTGKNISSANISVKEGKPSFTGVADDPPEVGTSGKGTYKTKINLYRKGLWKWIDPPKDYSDISTLVSVVQKDNKHYFALEADLPSGVNLARYPNAPTEPRLRPTVQAQPLELGNIVGTIRVQGKERPVYDKIVAKAAGGLVQRNPYNYEPKAI